MTHTPTRVAVLLSLLLSLSACSVMPFAQHAGTTPNGQQRFGKKRVVDKRDPVFLIAFDGSECTTTEEKYQNTKIGDNVLCMWRAR